MKSTSLLSILISASFLTACGGGGGSSDDPIDQQAAANVIDMDNVQQILETNANIAFAAYSDSVDTAVTLEAAIDDFAADPSQINLDAAKTAWLVSREPYGQTEVYRFRLSPIDSTNYADEDGPEGDINAWPLGEALIDYVVKDVAQTDDFETDQVGVTANGANINGGGEVTGDEAPQVNIISTVPAADITVALISNTATAGDEHDVIAGYHAIEFLLWGQDLNNNGMVTLGNDRETAVKTHDAATGVATGGQRPLTDFTSAPFADRRLKYLQVAVEKLVADLTQVRDSWEDGAAYRNDFTTIADEGEAKQKLAEILTGMGTLSEGELAGERMQISFSANSQEDEHSCFSDNTHRDIWLNAEGVRNSYYGDYAGYDSDLDGVDDESTRAVNGYGFDDYAAESDLTELADLATEMEDALDVSEDAYMAIDTEARAGNPVDVQIMNAASDTPMYDTILALNAQAAIIADVAGALEISGNVVDDDASGCDTTDPTSSCDE